MTIDLSKLSPSELDELMAEAAKQKKVRHKQQLGDARKQVVQYAKSLGYTIDELFGTGKGEKAKVKFHNPANPEQTWSGRGKRPNWFKEALASGKSKEDLAL
jgi:DNA-binding protein H-NS